MRTITILKNRQVGRTTSIIEGHMINRQNYLTHNFKDDMCKNCGLAVLMHATNKNPGVTVQYQSDLSCNDFLIKSII